jgi:hypothetical protein
MLNDRTLAWVILNCIGWGLLNLFIWGTFDLERGAWRAAEAGNDWQVIATYALIGLGMGFTQWLVLHFVIPRASLWILATTAGAAAGGLGARFLLASNHLGQDLLLIMFCVAILQALVLWPISRKAFWWIPAKSAGLMFSPYIVPVANIPEDNLLAEILGLTCACGGVLSATFIFPGLLFALITAYALAVILSGAPSKD